MQFFIVYFPSDFNSLLVSCGLKFLLSQLCLPISFVVRIVWALLRQPQLLALACPQFTVLIVTQLQWVLNHHTSLPVYICGFITNCEEKKKSKCDIKLYTEAIIRQKSLPVEHGSYVFFIHSGCSHVLLSPPQETRSQFPGHGFYSSSLPCVIEGSVLTVCPSACDLPVLFSCCVAQNMPPALNTHLKGYWFPSPVFWGCSRSSWLSSLGLGSQLCATAPAELTFLVDDCTWRFSALACISVSSEEVL